MRLLRSSFRFVSAAKKDLGSEESQTTNEYRGQEYRKKRGTETETGTGTAVSMVQGTDTGTVVERGMETVTVVGMV